MKKKKVQSTKSFMLSDEQLNSIQETANATAKEFWGGSITVSQTGNGVIRFDGIDKDGNAKSAWTSTPTTMTVYSSEAGKHLIYYCFTEEGSIQKHYGVMDPVGMAKLVGL
jgi:hypothetical protein